LYLLNPPYGNLSYWRSRPDTAGAITTHFDRLASRGAAWAFIRFAADHYSNGSVPRFARCLIRGSGDGAKRLGACAEASPQRIMSDWLVAMAIDHLDFIRAGIGYQYLSWDMRGVVLSHAQSTDPLVNMQLIPVTSDPATTTASAGSAGFFGVLLQSTEGARRILFRNAGSSGPMNFPGAIVSVVRVW
jgi:hypothetical protein